ncbi:MAG: holo-ACP synthase [Clostridia bacterium]|nr:holo-ACP synthase [Clostridia bacterium]
MKVGIDICEVKRFLGKPDKFFEGIFTKNEIEYAKSFSSSAEHFAGFFCVKEAVMKALGVGVEKIKPTQIEVLHNKNKKPYAVLIGSVKNIFEKMVEKNIEISISHTQETATAIAIFW